METIMTPAQFEDQQLGALLGYLMLALAVVGYLCLDWLTRRREQHGAGTTVAQLRAVCRRKGDGR
jgi:hypothetical protein